MHKGNNNWLLRPQVLYVSFKAQLNKTDGDGGFGIQVLELESTNVKALYRRAQAYMELSDLDLAEFDVKKALEIDPNNRFVSYSLTLI